MNEWKSDIVTELTPLHSPVRDVMHKRVERVYQNENRPRPLCTTVVTYFEHYDSCESITDVTSWRSALQSEEVHRGLEIDLSTLQCMTLAYDVSNWPLTIMAGQFSRWKSAYQAHYYYLRQLLSYSIGAYLWVLKVQRVSCISNCSLFHFGRSSGETISFT